MSETAAQIRRMSVDPYLYDLVRNRSRLNGGSVGLTPTAGETPRQWFTRAFAHPVFGAYCTFRRAGAPGERTPIWLTLMASTAPSGRYNLRRNPLARSYAEEDQALDLSGSDMLAEDSQESPGVSVNTDSYLGEDSNMAEDDEEEERME